MRTNESSAAWVEETVSPTAVEQFWQYLLGKRRNILVDRPYQLRVSLVGLLFVLAILIPLNLSFYYNITTDPATLEAAPELHAFLRAQDQAQFLLLLLGSVVFVVGHFVLNILETHHTAGAALALRRHLSKVEQGRYGVTIHLRRDDNLLDLEGAFNRMSHSVKQRTLDDLAQVETLADQAEQAGGAAEAREMAARLRIFADQLRTRIG